MRLLGVLLLAACPAAILAQPAQTDSSVMQTLLTEVQQLRLAIERQTLLSTRTQLAISQLQIQETRAASVAKDLAGAREANMHLKGERPRMTEAVKEMEHKRDLGDFSGFKSQEGLESEIKGMKLHLEMLASQEELASAREAELTAQFQTAQRDVQDSRSRIAEMERSLDAAIQQMLKPR